MKINWKVRFKNKTWVVAMVAAAFFVVQGLLMIFGISWDYSALLDQIITVIAGIYVVIGLIIDPTTAGTKDSEKVLQKRKDDK
ncbi:phage holin [Listeria ilorinensis]|uniref:phage holin n=1 Tax=Listeria ilorinensis TaxID=2867439 RepID=UPI001EF52C9C|nr:phage holin [Listeria ilorinensis]